MKFKAILGLCITGLFFFMSCEEEVDCVGCNLNPKIRLKFVALDTRESVDSILSAVKGRIAVLSDSLSKQLSSEQRSSVETELSNLRNDSIKYGEIFSLFRSGKTRISYIEAPGATGLEQFQDSIIRDFAIPVDMQRDTSTYYFGYYELVDTLQLSYRREIEQTLDGMRMLLHRIEVNEEITTFDSVRVDCSNPACSNDKTTVFIYF